MKELSTAGGASVSALANGSYTRKTMSENQIFLVPGFSPSPEPKTRALMQPPKVRFQKVGPNAEHTHTVRMRGVKEKLRLTTLQLVAELNAYEREHQATNFRQRAQGQPAWRKMSSVLMSSYLQGWVMQEEYMAQMSERLQNLYRHKAAQGEVAPKVDIRTIMNGWYKTLGIKTDDAAGSPTRHLARLVAPFYKRPVLAGVSGKLYIGAEKQGMLPCKIKTDKDEIHHFSLDPTEPLEVKHLEMIKVGQVLQYAVRMQSQKVDDQTVLSHEPSINHTTFFRWYSQNKLPRSIKTIELVQAAVDKAAAELKLAKKR